MAADTVTTIRPFIATDLLWLEPMAKKYDEWPDLLKSLTNAVAGFVIEPRALGLLFFDEHGLRIGGLTDEHGIKQFIKIGKTMIGGAKQTKTWLHGHWETDDWRAKMAQRFGFVLNGHGYYELKVSE